MKLNNLLLALVIGSVAWMAVPAAPALAQVFAGEGAESALGGRESVTLPEIRIMLLARDVPAKMVEQVLAAFPEDRVFDQDEAQILIDSTLALMAPRPGTAGERGTGEPLPPGTDAMAPGEKPTRVSIPAYRPPGEVPIFGQSIFRNAPEGFEPPEDVAVGPDYVLGAGDELSVTLWGSVQKHWLPQVERDGMVSLPEVGLVAAAGLSLGEFRETLRSRLAGVFSGFDLSVTLSSLRSIQVSVLGDVRRPGSYTLSPLANSFNALYYAGGPLDTGSLRDVKVFRGDELLATVDLYDLLVKGESGGDIRLGTDYRVFVPPVSGLVTVRGDVRRPGRYEVKPGETAGDLLRFAGGLTATSYTPRAVVERVRGFAGRVSLDVDLATQADTLQMQDGDVFTIYPVYHVEPRRFVQVSGEVQSSGMYELYPGMTVTDLVFRAGNLLESAHLPRAELSRLSYSEGDTVAVTLFFDLGASLAMPHGPSDLKLLPDDRLYVRRRPGWRPQARVDVQGEVRFPGGYTLTLREERLSQVLTRAGGLTDEAFASASALFRDGEGRIIVDFQRALDRPGGLEDVALADGDSVYVPRYNETIQVVGAVSRPGALVYQPGKTADYYLRRTGGLSENADEGRIHIVKVDGVVEKARRSMWFDPEVPPGAVIEVATKAEGEGVDWMAAVRDATTIVSGLATTIFIVTQIK